MATVYATLIIKGLKTIEDVPELLVDKVKTILNAKGFDTELLS